MFFKIFLSAHHPTASKCLNNKVAMKIIIWLLLAKLFVQDISSNENILSKLHQSGFKIKDVRAELVNYNETFFNKVEIKTYKYNRTTPVINCTINTKITLGDKTEIVIQVYKFLSNEYRHFPIRFQVNLKKAFDSNAIGLKAIKKCGNLTTLYFEKDITYYVCNFIVDETQLPPLIPNGKYKVEVIYLYLNEEFTHVDFFGEVYVPMTYPKKQRKNL